jgi:hypothetical protein
MKGFISLHFVEMRFLVGARHKVESVLDGHNHHAAKEQLQPGRRGRGRGGLSWLVYLVGSEGESD